MTEEEPIITYTQLVAANVRAARAAADLGQGDVSERMNALGFTEWRRQTVSLTERARRVPRADELLALSLCLQTTRDLLMTPPGATKVILPGGQVVTLEGTGAPPRLWPAAWWHGNEPRFPTAGTAGRQR